MFINEKTRYVVSIQIIPLMLWNTVKYSNISNCILGLLYQAVLISDSAIRIL